MAQRTGATAALIAGGTTNWWHRAWARSKNRVGQPLVSSTKWTGRRQDEAAAMSLAEIRSNFDLLDDWEDRYRYVIELGRALPPLAETFKTDAYKVRGCASQVWLVSRSTPAGPGTAAHLAFEGDSDAFIVRGLIAILLSAIEGKTADDLAKLDLQQVFDELGLKDHLTPQRSNGLASMIQRVKADARAAQSPAGAATA